MIAKAVFSDLPPPIATPAKRCKRKLCRLEADFSVERGTLALRFKLATVGPRELGIEELAFELRL
jgi:hypothetical protein